MREGMTGGYFMLYATYITMKPGCKNSQSLLEIDQIYIPTRGWYKKEDLYNELVRNPKTVAVNISPYPYLIPALSRNREKYVRSTPDIYKHDDLLDLPRL